MTRVWSELLVVLMPPSKKSAEERAAAHVLRAQAIRNESQSKAIHAWLRARPDLIPDVHAHLSALMNQGQQSAGGDARAVPGPQALPRPPLALPWVAADGAVVPTPASAAAATAAAAAEEGGNTVSPAPSVAGGQSSEAKVAEGGDGIAPHNYSFAAMSVSHLKELLEHLDSRVFNRFNIRSIVQKGEAKKNKQLLLEILEFATNIQVNSSPGCSTWTTLKETLAQKYAFLGCRAAELPLPPRWPDDGVYSLMVQEDTGDLLIKHNFLADHPVKAVGLPPGWSARRVLLSDNFSESGAYLSDPLVHGMPLKAMTLFDTVAMNTSRPRLRRPPSASSLSTPESQSKKRPKAESEVGSVMPKKLCFEIEKEKEAFQEQQFEQMQGTGSASSRDGMHDVDPADIPSPDE